MNLVMWMVLSLAARSLACIAQPGMPPAEYTQQSLLDRVVAAWPEAGTVRAEYSDEIGNVLLVGFAFESGAWYRDNQRTIVGVEPGGIAYAGRADIDGLEVLESPHQGLSITLDPYFPTVMLREILSLEGAVESIRAGSEGGFIIVARLPRGSRAYAIDELPPPELARWGGEDAVMREVIIELRENLTVASYRTTGLNGSEVVHNYDVAACSLPGFQITAMASNGIPLQSFSHHPEIDSSRFSAGEIGAAAIQRKLDHPERRPVLTAEEVSEQSRPTPVRQGDESTAPATGVVGAGLLLLFVGVAAWLRARRS